MHGLVDLVIKVWIRTRKSKDRHYDNGQKIKDNDLQNNTQKTEISNTSLKIPKG